MEREMKSKKKQGNCTIIFFEQENSGILKGRGRKVKLLGKMLKQNKTRAVV